MKSGLKEQQKIVESIHQNLAGVEKKIVVMSGKGGVGKTTIAINLAAQLAKKSETALLDADVDCPNINDFLGIERGFSLKNNKLLPLERFGMKVVSFASLQEKKDVPTIWRGPMLSKALKEILNKTNWGSLDYLVVDLPPGTSDAPLTIMQVLKPDGAIVVTTPNKAALTDAKKSVKMAEQLSVSVWGILENMSGEIFGTGGGESAAAELGVEFLGRVSLDKRISQAAEEGYPFLLEETSLAPALKTLANEISQGGEE